MNIQKLAGHLAITSAAGFGAFALAPAAIAQSGSDGPADGGLYVSVLAGVTSPTDSDFQGVQNPQAPSPGTAGAPALVSLGFEEDFIGTVAVGYRLEKRFLGIFQPSIEIEYSKSSPSVDGGSFNAGNQTFGGDFKLDTYSLNYQSDIRWSRGQRVIPFLGGGIGIADVSANATYFPNNGVATAPTFAVRDTDTGISLHSNAGLTFKLSDNIDVSARVRYQRVTELEFDRRFIAAGNDAFNARLKGSFETVSLLSGVHLRF